jgi:hypothetical protein
VRRVGSERQARGRADQIGGSAAVKTFIVSGGGIEFMRVFAENAHGIPPEQVVGSSGAMRFQIGANGGLELLKLPKIEFVDDGAGKPAGIYRFIGRRPIFDLR